MLKEDFGGILSLIAVFGISAFFLGLAAMMVREAFNHGATIEVAIAIVGFWVLLLALALARLFSED
jgi:hypothetical protein